MDTPLPAPWCAALARSGYTIDETARAHDDAVVVAAGGSRASLTIVALPDDRARARCTEHLERWRGVDDPGIDRLDDALDLGDAVALVRPCTGGTLAEFVERQGRLTAGQASTLLVVLGRALARLHADGLVYGPMTPHDVRIVDGRPRLVEPAPVPTGTHAVTPSPAEDAYNLAALTDSVVVAAYGPGAAERPAASLRALRRTIVTALGDAPSRPGVGTLAALSHDIAPCQPLVLLEPPVADSAQSAVHGERRLRERSRRRAAVTVVGAVVAVLATVAWWSGGGRVLADGDVGPGGQDARRTGPTIGAPAVDGPADGPAAAAASLTEERFDLLARMTATEPDIDARAWAAVTVIGSPAHTQVLDLVAVLVQDGSSLSGLSATVESATLLEEDTGTATVEVVYSTSEYAVRGAVGSSVVPAATGQSAVLTLVETDEGWRVSDVAEAVETGAAARAVGAATSPPHPSTGG